MLFAGSLAANAQIGNILNKAKDKPKQDQAQKTPTKEKAESGTAQRKEGNQDQFKDSEYLIMAANGLDREKIAKMRACLVGGDITSYKKTHPPMSEQFLAWSSNIDITAAIRSFQAKTCQVIAFYIDKDPNYKYNSIDSLTETAQGTSIYKVEVDKLVLIRKVEASQFYVVIVPDHNKPGLKLADLRICGSPATIDLYKRRVVSGSYCHDQKDKLYIFEKYKSYPGPMQDSSVLFDAAEFNELNKQGKFKGLVIYKLVGDELVAAK
jgi:hypothetical protein